MSSSFPPCVTHATTLVAHSPPDLVADHERAAKVAAASHDAALADALAAHEKARRRRMLNEAAAEAVRRLLRSSRHVGVAVVDAARSLVTRCDALTPLLPRPPPPSMLQALKEAAAEAESRAQAQEAAFKQSAAEAESAAASAEARSREERTNQKTEEEAEAARRWWLLLRDHGRRSAW